MLRYLTLLACATTGLIGASVAASAQTAATIDGGELAARLCGRCHATGPTGESPQRRVIPFRSLHERYPVDMLVEAARTGVIAGHDEMPMFAMSPQEVQALLAHIDALAPEKPGYLTRVPAHR